MRLLIWLVTLVTLGSGALNLYSVMGPSLPERSAVLREIFPLALQGFSRTTEMLTGLGLVIASVHIARRRKRAWFFAFGLTWLSIAMHMAKGLDYEEASLSLILAGLLWISRKSFVYGSGIPSLRTEGVRVGMAAAVILAYGTLGFWVLEPSEFHRNFHWDQALRHALRALSFINDPRTVPHTAYAAWFLDSLQWMSLTLLAYAGLSLFRPVLHRFQTRSKDLAEAAGIVTRHGRNAQDYFKTWPDKSIFFDNSRQAFLAYRVAGGFAVVLGDPVGPPDRIGDTVEQFDAACRENGWRMAFHQVTPEYLHAFESLGYRRLKVGDEAIVQLESFTLSGSSKKGLRTAVNRMEREGVTAILYEAPLADEVLAAAREVSDDWLRQPGNRERGFTLGWFEDDYVRSTSLLAAVDASGRMLGFVNLMKSSREGEATVDLMRRRLDAPNGIMDFLFVKLIFESKQRGFTRFNLGMAPLAGFQPGEQTRADERAIHSFFQRWNLGFRFSGLKEYKSKFATLWEPRYAMYRNALDLPRLGLALARVSAMRPGEK